MEVEVAFATPNKQNIIVVQLQGAPDVQDAIIKSGIIEQFSEIDLLSMKVGVFGKVCDLDKILEDGDRVEIYRPLLINPMDARRNRALKPILY